jgi:hypothetical protein
MDNVIRGMQKYSGCYKMERRFETWWGEGLFSIYLILLATLGSGVFLSSLQQKWVLEAEKCFWGVEHSQWPLYPRGKRPGTQWIRGRVGPRALLDAVEEGKISWPAWNSTPPVQPVAGQYTDRAILAISSITENRHKLEFKKTMACRFVITSICLFDLRFSQRWLPRHDTV